MQPHTTVGPQARTTANALNLFEDRNWVRTVFSRQVVATISKRAGGRCSNPDCDTLTSGPADEPSRAVSVGEAAHIYGAHPGSARFDSAMMSNDRADITNAIWLCCNCHKIVDDDARRFPADLLFAWKRNHESKISLEVGKVGAAIRQKVDDRRLIPFKHLSPLTQQIVLDKPDYWEFKLTSEILRQVLYPIDRRWSFLKDKAYSKPLSIISEDDFILWQAVRFEELQAHVHAIGAVMNGRIQETWGEDDKPGDELQILQVCELLAEGCQSLLMWEEAISFAFVPPAFEDAQSTLKGIAGALIEEVGRMPKMLAAIFDNPNPAGEYRIMMTADLPDDFPERYQAALARGMRDIALAR